MPFGMQCTTIVQDPKMKQKITLVTGLGSIVASVFIGIAVSWYAALVVSDYQTARFPGGNMDGVSQTYIYGKALYIGCVAMSTLAIQGLVICCAASGNSTDSGYHHALQSSYGQEKSYYQEEQY